MKTATDYDQDTIQSIAYDDVIINAIPKKITRYENPIVIEVKYEIEFETPTGQVFKTEPKTIEEILVELKVKGLIYKTRAAEEALPAILNAYHRENKLTVKRELETPGFYLIENKIIACKVEQEYRLPTKEEIVRCADVLNKLVTKYKRKEIMPSLIKWGIVSPFSYVLKQLEEGEERWMPWLYPYGWTNTGKTTSGRIVLAIWRKHKDNSNNITKYLELNKDSVLHLAEKNYENLVEELTNDSITNASSNATLSSPRSSWALPNLSDQNNTYRIEEPGSFHNSEGEE
jgi:hypothetical protein